MNEGLAFNSAGPFVFNSPLSLLVLFDVCKSINISPAREHLAGTAGKLRVMASDGILLCRNRGFAAAASLL
jgi:hypothetical protein